METDVTHLVTQQESQTATTSESMTKPPAIRYPSEPSSDESDFEDSDLKEVMQSEDAGSSFFQRYFQNHSNSLPSRLMGSNPRRLSQCREEDEDDDKKDQSVGVEIVDLRCVHGLKFTKNYKWVFMVLLVKSLKF